MRNTGRAPTPLGPPGAPVVRTPRFPGVPNTGPALLAVLRALKLSCLRSGDVGIRGVLVRWAGEEVWSYRPWTGGASVLVEPTPWWALKGRERGRGEREAEERERERERE